MRINVEQQKESSEHFNKSHKTKPWNFHVDLLDYNSTSKVVCVKFSLLHSCPEWIWCPQWKDSGKHPDDLLISHCRCAGCVFHYLGSTPPLKKDLWNPNFKVLSLWSTTVHADYIFLTPRNFVWGGGELCPCAHQFLFGQYHLNCWIFCNQI